MCTSLLINNANVYGILTLATRVFPYMEIHQIIKLIYIGFSLQIMFRPFLEPSNSRFVQSFYCTFKSFFLSS